MSWSLPHSIYCLLYTLKYTGTFTHLATNCPVSLQSSMFLPVLQPLILSLGLMNQPESSVLHLATVADPLYTTKPNRTEWDEMNNRWTQINEAQTTHLWWGWCGEPSHFMPDVAHFVYSNDTFHPLHKSQLATRVKEIHERNGCMTSHFGCENSILHIATYTVLL